MNSQRKIYLISGPCGSGKSSFVCAYAEHLAKKSETGQVYVIHGDSFHQGFVESDKLSSGKRTWGEILRFNWNCILYVAKSALKCGLDVLIDYVVEDELPLVQALARENKAKLYYLVLTTSPEEIQRRITQRGDVELIERALFLREKLGSCPENQRHLLDNSKMSLAEEIKAFEQGNFELVL